jgi:hypothetical protein
MPQSSQDHPMNEHERERTIVKMEKELVIAKTLKQLGAAMSISCLALPFLNVWDVDPIYPTIYALVSIILFAVHLSKVQNLTRRLKFYRLCKSQDVAISAINEMIRDRKKR